MIIILQVFGDSPDFLCYYFSSSNLLTDNDQLGYLCLCQNLTILNLANNPIAHGLNETSVYRETIRETIPHLKVLDEIPFNGVDTTGLRSVSNYNLASDSIVNNWRDVNKGLLSPWCTQDKGTIQQQCKYNINIEVNYHENNLFNNNEKAAMCRKMLKVS